MSDDSATHGTTSSSLDTAQVLAYLRGATRGPRDPDVFLAEMLSLIEEISDKAALLDALEQLVADARKY